MLPKLIATDVDGVLTSGGMYYDEHFNELKKFNVSDGVGVIFCKLLQIPVAIFTGENTPIVSRRAKKLGIEHVFLGCKNKVQNLSQLCQQLGIDPQQVAYIGDDINDIQMLKTVGFSACPANAPLYVRKYAHITLSKKGGQGVFREFVEYILQRENLLNHCIELFLTQEANKS